MKKYRYKFVKDFVNFNGEVLISKKYIGIHEKLEIRCNECNTIYLKSFSHFKNGQRCQKCANKRKGNYKRLELKDIKQKTKGIALGYRCLSNKYINNYTKLKFECNINHIFKMCWKNFFKGHRCPTCYKESKKGENNIFWKGGIVELNIPLYDTYAHQISFCEEVHRDLENPDHLQVRCTELSCRKWFIPTIPKVTRRITAINNTNRGESRLYCSEECKERCSIYRRSMYPKGFKSNDQYRPDQQEWRSLVLERDNHTCQRCGETEDLVAHHIEGLNVNPIMSADVDMGITLCRDCHEKAHKEKGCRFVDLTISNLCSKKMLEKANELCKEGK